MDAFLLVATVADRASADLLVRALVYGGIRLSPLNGDPIVEGARTTLVVARMSVVGNRVSDGPESYFSRFNKYVRSVVSHVAWESIVLMPAEEVPDIAWSCRGSRRLKEKTEVTTTETVFDEDQWFADGENIVYEGDA